MQREAQKQSLCILHHCHSRSRAARVSFVLTRVNLLALTQQSFSPPVRRLACVQICQAMLRSAAYGVRPVSLTSFLTLLLLVALVLATFY